MAMRLSGLMSGMDTESIVQELVAVKQIKIDELVKEQTKLEWKQEAWKELNTKIKKLYNGTLSNLRFQSAYAKKTTKISDSSVADIVTGTEAMDSVQKLRVKTLAQSGYLTGGEICKADGSKCTSGTKIADILRNAEEDPDAVINSKIEVNTNGKSTEISINESTTVADLVNQLKNAGLKANFDSKTQRLFIGASESGEEADFTITAVNAQGTTALNKLGILVYNKDEKAEYQKYASMLDGDGNILDANGNIADADEVTPYRTELDTLVAESLAAYIEKAKALEESIQKQEEALTSITEAYDEKYAEEDDYVSLNALVTDENGVRTEMENKLKELEKIERYEELTAKEELTEEEQTELDELVAELDPDNKDLAARKEALLTEKDELVAKLKYVENYLEAENTLEETEEKLTEAKSYFEVTTSTDEAGETVETKVASQKLKKEVEAALREKIANAQAVVASGFVGSANATKVEGTDAEIYLNDAYFTSSSNTFEINNLTITCNNTTGDKEVTLTTQNDTSGVYDMIKNFIVEYSELINEMDKLYNADSAKGYEPLTDDEKYEMSEKEVEKWEDKIKEALLRRDSTLSSVSSAFKSVMSSGFVVGGKTMYLSDFGIETLGYFEAADNERNAYHIDGDEDDEHVSSETNVLKAMISAEPDTVMDFFSQLTKSLYDKTSDLMKSVQDYSSSYTVYEDKKMKADYDDYTEKIKELEEKLADYEDKWYNKFSAMETAMAKMQSNANAITSLIGG